MVEKKINKKEETKEVEVDIIEGKEEISLKKEKFTMYNFKGTQEEMGKEFGDTFKDEIKNLSAFYYSELYRIYGAKKTEIVELLKTIWGYTNKYSPNASNFMKGISAGSKCNIEDVVILNSILELQFYLDKFIRASIVVQGAKKYSICPIACTSGIATSPATKDNVTIIAQNLDFAKGTDIKLVKLEDNKSKVSVLGFSMNCSLPIVGITSKGLAYCVLLIHSKRVKLGVPSIVLSYEIMQQKNLGESIGVLGKSDRIASFVNLLASYEGDAAVVETTRNDLEVLLPDDGIIAHANNSLVDRFKFDDCCAEEIIADSFMRTDRLTRLLKKDKGDIDIYKVRDILRDKNGAPDSICRDYDKDDPEFARIETLFSFVALPKEKIFYATNGKPTETSFVKYSL